MLHRFPTGVTGEKVHQKRLPGGAPAVDGDRAAALPALEPHRRRALRHRDRPGRLGGADVDRRVPPVEQPARATPRSPTSGASTSTRATTATSTPSAGSRTSPTRSSTSSARPASRRPPAATGMHVYVRIRPEHGFKDVRRAALAFAREVERRTDDVTTTWWRKDRDPTKLFVDYNQNARDHTIAAAYSVRGNPEAHGLHADPLGRGRRRASPRDLTIATVPGALRRARRPARGHRRRGLRHRPAAGVGRARRARGPGDPAGAGGLRLPGDAGNLPPPTASIPWGDAVFRGQPAAMSASTSSVGRTSPKVR